MRNTQPFVPGLPAAATPISAAMQEHGWLSAVRPAPLANTILSILSTMARAPLSCNFTVIFLATTRIRLVAKMGNFVVTVLILALLSLRVCASRRVQQVTEQVPDDITMGLSVLSDICETAAAASAMTTHPAGGVSSKRSPPLHIRAPGGVRKLITRR